MGRAELVGRIEDRLGIGLVFDDVSELGETAGAIFATSGTGERLAITLATVAAVRMREAAEVLARLRDDGVPVPLITNVLDLGDGTVAVVQERLPGEPATAVDVDAVDGIVAVNDRFAGVLAARPDIPMPAPVLSGIGRGFPDVDAIVQYGLRSRDLVERILRFLAGRSSWMTGDDLVHSDLTAPNVLFLDGRVSGVVDWNGGILRGDRHYALVKLYFDLVWSATDPRFEISTSALERLASHLRRVLDPDVLRVYWASWTLQMLHWTVRSGDATAIDVHLGLGEMVFPP